MEKHVLFAFVFVLALLLILAGISLYSFKAPGSPHFLWILGGVFVLVFGFKAIYD